MKLEKNDKLLMIGDSITDVGRARPVGEGLFDAYGNGYVNFVKGLLDCSYPELAIRVVNMGCSGDTVRQLKERWQTDVIDQNPQWLSIMIGINDVWRQFDIPKQLENHIMLDEYEATLCELIGKVRPSLKGLVLMTPYYIEPCLDDAMRARMDQYGVVMKKLADQYDAIFVDTQKAMNGMLEHFHSSYLAWDRVHPNVSGHMALAKAFLKSIDFEF
ncbi:MAG: SGNH/GDSL hydrolase family protein [Kiritimatiellae bacterium]|jgi:lysophospholipase L1-like esterase|nr:SGNH/GDSL hydrolase family protein [Kiritimatiellia bacterium]